jgi:hypothetical protein
MHVWEHQIEHNDVELAGLGEVDSFGPSAGYRDAVILGAQPPIDEIRDSRLVFDQEDVHRDASG